MEIRRWLQTAVRNRTSITLIALLITFAGADLLIHPTGSDTQRLAIPLLAVGAGLFAWAVWPRGTIPSISRSTLASRFIYTITWRGRLIRYFPAFGAALVATDLAYNAVLSGTPALLTEDTILFLGAGVLLAYGFVPNRFARERDFILLFAILLNAILVAPLLLARVLSSDFERSVDLYSWVALAPQTGALLNLLGVSNSVHPVAGSTAPGLTFVPRNTAIQVTVVITTACSGIYSFAIFGSAFIAFVLSEYDRLYWRTWALLGLGFLSAYVANVLRMAVIVLVGYFTDTTSTALQSMLIAHSYAGWLIFLGWTALFWAALLRLLPIGPARVRPAAGETRRQSDSRCGICAAALTPVRPATRCECGEFFHRACLTSARRCPSCGRGGTEGPTIAAKN